MKATELVKKERDINLILEDIKVSNDNGNYKHVIPHFMFVSDATKSRLINLGFKVSFGQWDSMMTGLIIEW